MTSMNTTKYEDNLLKYVDNTLMSDAYREGVNNKLSMSETELTKVSESVRIKRIHAQQIKVFPNLLDSIEFVWFVYPPTYNPSDLKQVYEALSICISKALGVFRVESTYNLKFRLIVRGFLISDYGYQGLTPPQSQSQILEDDNMMASYEGMS